MSTSPTYGILVSKASLLSTMGYRLRLWQDGSLWRWEWNNGISGSTDANSKGVALVFALESI